MHENLKRLYFKRALTKKHRRRPPARVRRQLYPERIEANYLAALTEIVKFAKSRVDARIKPLIPRLSAYYARNRKDAADEPEKYYSAFIYADTKKADVLHCTHKYLGELSRPQLVLAEKKIDAFFLRNAPELPRAKFDRVQYFGPERDVRVLTPENDDAFKPFSTLLDSLDSLREDDFPEYRPHVTTDLDSINEPFSHYAIISKRGIHRTWPKTIKADADIDGIDFSGIDLANVIAAPASLNDLANALDSVRIDITQEYSKEELRRLAKLTGTKVAEWNERQMNGQLKGIVEIDLFGSEPWLAKEMGAFVVQNVSLIESLPDEYLGQVEKMISTSVRSGVRAEDIAAELEDRFDVSESRAKLIARDQIGKFNGQLTEARQTDLGIDSYKWRTAGDARVRETHRENALRDEGSGPGVYSWDDPPETGHPGDDYQCRCWAEPVLAKFYGDDA